MSLKKDSMKHNGGFNDTALRYVSKDSSSISTFVFVGGSDETHCFHFIKKREILSLMMILRYCNDLFQAKISVRSN